MKSVLSVVLLCAVASVGFCQTGKVADRAVWYAMPKHPGEIGLYVGDELIGRLDIFQGTWRHAGHEPVNMRAWVYKENPPKSSTGAKPIGLDECDKPTSDKPVEDKSKKAGVVDDLDKPTGEKVGAKPAEGCKCGQGCECMDGHVGIDCKCAKGECKCAIVNTAPRLKGKDGTPDIRDNGPRPIPDGVKWDSISRVEKFSIGGPDGEREADRSEALSAIEAASDVPNDSALIRFTVIGSTSARKRVLNDLETSPALAYWKGRLLVTSYPSDHWRIKDGGFKSPTDVEGVTIYVQKPDGTVLWRQDNYDGADGMARSLRDKVPGYDPSKDPQPSKPTPTPAASGSVNYWWGSVPVALLGVLYLFRRK